jgi:hypothetical protein
MARESDAQNRIRIEAARHGLMLWRNNSGALADKDGRLVRFGLGNDSPTVNRVIKSSDLIGLYRGRFVAVEVKPLGWKYTGTEREVAQLNYINLVKKHGGIACFATQWSEVYEAFVKNGAAGSGCEHGLGDGQGIGVRSPDLRERCG